MAQKYSIKDFLEVKSAGQPSFSPDGSKIAYLSNETGTYQLYLMPTQGGEFEQLTNYPDAVSFAYFSPVEDKIIFGKHEGGNEQTQFFLLDLANRETTDLTRRPDIRHDFGAWSGDGKKICFSSTERNGVDFDVYVMEIETLEKKCVFDGGKWCKAAGFSPRGTYVIVGQGHSNVNSDLYLCNVETGDVEHLTPHTGNVHHASPSWLPDESAFFLLQDKGRDFMGLGKYVLADKKFEYLITPDWDVERAVVDKTGRHLGVVVNEEGYNKLRIYGAASLEERSFTIPSGNVDELRFSNDGTRLALVIGDPRHTFDIWIADLSTGEAQKLTASTQGVPPETLVEPELMRYTSFDGLTIPSFVYRPTDAPGGKLPVIIHIHGGPEAQYQPALSPLIQFFVHHGYIVAAPNVRGSSGYGKTYLGLDDVEKRLDSVKDIVALKEHLSTLPDVDSDKVVLMGGSYGGFMVLAGLAFYPKLWAAGVDTVGIVNFVTFLENTAAYRRAYREAEYGSLERDRDLLERISPINSIEHIEAPLFVIHGANDPRVPLSEAEQVVSKLKELGREVELLVYPDEGHGLAKLSNRLDAYPKVVAFLDKVLNT